MEKVPPLVQQIHNPLVRGSALLFLPKGLLVRWPDRMPFPQVGEPFHGVAVVVPRHLLRVALDLLFSPSPLARCDAAKVLAAEPIHRRTVLLRIYSRPHVQQLLAAANKLSPEERQQLQGVEKGMPIRELFRRARI